MSDAILAALRQLLPAHGLDFYLVGRGDAHAGEEVAAASDRLARVSGFTGSAGLAIVGADRAALFTDGRYMPQVGDETGPDWECHHQDRTAPRDWLAGRGRGGLRVGYDPMLLGRTARDGLDGGWGVLVPIDGNLVDQVWPDRPPPPDGPARVQDRALTGRTVAEKLALIGAALAAAGDDAAILSDTASVCWLLDIRGTDLVHTPAVLAHALVRRDGTAVLFLDPARADAAVRAHLGPDVALVPPEAMADTLAGCAGRRVQVDSERSPVWFEQCLGAHGATVIAAPDPCLLPKARKTAAERAAFREGHRHDGAALCRFLRWVVSDGPGRTEHAVSERLLAFRLATGACLGTSFAPIVAVGRNAALMHYHPAPEGSAVLGRDQLLLVDSGGQYPGATTDVTRTVWLGPGAPPAAFRAQFTAVLQGLIGLTVATFPDGTSGHRLDTIARLALWRQGRDFDHGAGHGLGSQFSVHEWPYAFSSRPPGGPVHAGMILTNEPGTYLPGSHGIRLENAMEVEALPGADDMAFCGFATLTLAPFDRGMIDAARLDAAELGWLDGYHATVLATIAPLLDGEDAAWLAAACAPLAASA